MSERYSVEQVVGKLRAARALCELDSLVAIQIATHLLAWVNQSTGVHVDTLLAHVRNTLADYPRGIPPR